MKKLPYLLTCLFFFIAVGQSFIHAQDRKPPTGSPLNKAYHHVTAKYNGYFNAQLKLQEGINNLESSYTDNYNQILDMFKFSAVPEVKGASGDLDVAITKAAVDVKLHPTSLFVDDCYLLIGQAQYVKRDFESAEATFSWMITEFDPKGAGKTDTKNLSPKQKAKLREQEKKAKEKQRELEAKQREEMRERRKEALAVQREQRRNKEEVTPLEDLLAAYEEEDEKKKEKGDKKENYVIKHRPVRQDAMLWLARTQIERDKFDEAQVWLNRLEKDPKLMKQVKGDLAAIKAYYHLKKKDYDAAVQPLEDAIKLAKKRQDKARYAYILAQIHQFADREKEAFAAYERVIKFRPDYEMEFSARLNMIKNTFDDGEALAKAEDELKKLLKDEKNEEYQDQIYYALADIAFKSDDDDKAIGYLKKSVYYNFGNEAQKSESYLKLADTYYDNEDYVDAKYYYDSTLTVIRKTDERFDVVELRSKSLTDIATNIKIVEKQDSFLRIKGLVDGNKEKEYMVIAQSIKDAEEAAKQAEKNKGKKPQLTQRAQAVSAANITTAGGGGRNNVPKFWAYDIAGVQKGKKEFQKVWGSRKLSDNWRRSNRIAAGDDVDFATDESEVFDLTKEEALAIFKRIGVPQDDKAKDAADTKIIDAMSALGTLYRERLNNIEKSIDILEKLVNRYPKNKYKLESLYSLYIMHNQLNNQSEANKYKSQILKEDLNSKFAKAISDPNFLKKEEAKELKIQDYYNDAYANFKSGEFTTARNKVDKVEAQFGKEYSMKPKFALLGAMCTGGIDGSDAYKVSLQEIVSKYPETDEATKANEILAILGGKKIVTKKNDKPQDENKIFKDEETGFTVNNKSSHFIIVAYDGKKLKQTAAAAAISDYNKKYHRLKRLRTTGFLINIETPTILVRRFNDKKSAMEYINEVNKNPKEYLGVEDKTFKIMALNQDNYKLILRDRSKWAIYEGFFNKYYVE